MNRVIVMAMVCALGFFCQISPSWANAPSPTSVCMGKREGDSCAGRYYPHGICKMSSSPLCEDDPDNKTCLHCETPPAFGCAGCSAANGTSASGSVLLLLLFFFASWRRSRRRLG